MHVYFWNNRNHVLFQSALLKILVASLIFRLQFLQPSSTQGYTYILGNFSLTSWTDVSEPSSIIANLESKKRITINFQVMVIKRSCTLSVSCLFKRSLLSATHHWLSHLFFFIEIEYLISFQTNSFFLSMI